MGIFSSNLNDIRQLPLAAFHFDLALDRLRTGADNIRTDVHFSEDLHLAADTLALAILARKCKAGRVLGVEPSPSEMQSRINAFKLLCQDVMRDAVNKAKIQREIQINTLCQVGLIKLAVAVSEKQYVMLLETLERRLRDEEISSNAKQENFLRLQQLFLLAQKRKRLLIRTTARDIAQIIRDSQRGEISRIRESSFGGAGQLPEAMLDNPLLNVGDPMDGLLAMTEYGILTHDPVSYEKVREILTNILSKVNVDEQSPAALPAVAAESLDSAETLVPADGAQEQGPEAWLLAPENAANLFDYQSTKTALRNIRRRRDAGDERRQLKMRASHQSQLMKHLKARLRSNRLLKPIAALPEAGSILAGYCPPLTPEEVLNAIVGGRGWRHAAARLRQVKSTQKKELSIQSLKAAAGKAKRLNSRERERRLISFMERFLRFHRDRVMWQRLNTAMDGIYLVTDSPHALLSRANYTLYEFLLPHDQMVESKPVIKHTIIKSDLRGSTDITYRLNKAGLNPASFFSLNFFNPITESLSEYGAEKVFIEGDAIILAILEHEASPEGWYSVSRACGLATRMIQIVQQVNREIQNTDLPRLEQGIGIGFLDRPPTFLFDGLTRIMISPAINLADRLSGCAKVLKHRFTKSNSPFNLEVFKASTQTGDPKTADDLSLRYNVNGIEISEPAFEKLAREIDLRTATVRLPGADGECARIYTGTFPTLSGRFQRLVIRKSPIAVIHPESLEIQGNTEKYFYEVCTHPGLIKLAEKICAV